MSDDANESIAAIVAIAFIATMSAWGGCVVGAENGRTEIARQWCAEKDQKEARVTDGTVECFTPQPVAAGRAREAREP